MKTSILIPGAGLFAIIATAAYMVVQLDAQVGVTPADLRNATAVEVRDAQNRVVLNGQFAPPVADDGDDDNVERIATLQQTGVDTDAVGEAEIEYAREGAAMQEVEFDGENLANGTVYTLLVDGSPVATATANSDGDVEIEVDVPIPGAANAAAR